MYWPRSSPACKKWSSPLNTWTTTESTSMGERRTCEALWRASEKSTYREWGGGYMPVYIYEGHSTLARDRTWAHGRPPSWMDYRNKMGFQFEVKNHFCVTLNEKRTVISEWWSNALFVLNIVKQICLPPTSNLCDISRDKFTQRKFLYLYDSPFIVCSQTCTCLLQL